MRSPRSPLLRIDETVHEPAYKHQRIAAVERKTQPANKQVGTGSYDSTMTTFDVERQEIVAELA